MHDAFEQKRISVDAQQSVDWPFIIRLVHTVATHATSGFKLHAIELVFERPVSVAAPTRRPQVSPPQREGDDV